MKDEHIAILFSGGSDSLLATSIVQENYKYLHLITYERFGFFNVENSKKNVELLKNRFPDNVITHEIINFDPLFKYLSYENYLKNLFKYGFQNLSTCGICKLAMHTRTIKYCHDNNITKVADGANQGMNLFPAQMREILDEMRDLYNSFGIDYLNPVFGFAPPVEKEFVHEMNRCKLSKYKDNKTERNPENKSTEDVLFEKGLIPDPQIKGTKYDKERQSRCSQLILFNVYVKKYLDAESNYDEYVKSTITFYKDKIGTSSRLLSSNFQDGKNQKVFKTKHR